MNAITKSQPAGEVAEYGASLVEVIARAARDPSVDIDKMERLIVMQERVEARNAEVAFAADFATMQPNLPAIGMNGQIVHNGKVISEFSDWPNINKAVAPVLAEHGFSLSFKPDKVDGQVAVTAILRHRLGHRDTATLPLPTDTSGAKNQVQAVGSTLTYGKRYCGVLILNLTIEGEDDDGSAAAPKIQHQAPRDQPFPQGPAKNKTDLKTKGREFWRDVEACGDLDTLEPLLSDNRALVEQIKDALPDWWTGGRDRDGNSFEGLDHVIQRVRRDCAAASVPDYIKQGADRVRAG